MDTQAQGQANFKLSKDGRSLECKLTVAGVVDASSAELRLATPEGIDEVVMYLFQATNDDYIPGRFSGLAIKGPNTAGDLEGPLADGTLSDLAEAMDEGRIYVSVHTGNDYAPLIRGQVK